MPHVEVGGSSVPGVAGCKILVRRVGAEVHCVPVMRYIGTALDISRFDVVMVRQVGVRRGLCGVLSSFGGCRFVIGICNERASVSAVRSLNLLRSGFSARRS